MNSIANSNITSKGAALFFAAFFISNPSFSNNIDKCNSTSLAMNYKLPRQIDSITILNKTYCVSSNGKLFFQYDHTVLKPELLPSNIKKISFLSAKKIFCSGSYRNTLNYWTYDFFYLDGQGRPLYSFSIAKNDC